MSIQDDLTAAVALLTKVQAEVAALQAPPAPTPPTPLPPAAPAQLGINPTALTFMGSGTQTLHIGEYHGQAALTGLGAATDGAAWLSIGALPDSIEAGKNAPVGVTANAAGLAAGTYTSSVTLTAAPGSWGNPQTLTVTLNVPAAAPTTGGVFVGVDGDSQTNAQGLPGQGGADRFGAIAALSFPTWNFQIQGLGGVRVSQEITPDPAWPINGDTRDHLLAEQWATFDAAKRYIVLQAAINDIRADGDAAAAYRAAVAEARYWQGLGYTVIRTTIVPADAGAAFNALIRADTTTGWIVCDFAAQPITFQADGLHPDLAGQQIMAAALVKTLQNLG